LVALGCTEAILQGKVSRRNGNTAQAKLKGEREQNRPACGQFRLSSMLDPSNHAPLLLLLLRKTSFATQQLIRKQDKWYGKPKVQMRMCNNHAITKVSFLLW
jgi:hypothetical protein